MKRPDSPPLPSQSVRSLASRFSGTDSGCSSVSMRSDASIGDRPNFTGEESRASAGPVLCDVCPNPAVKTCLTCRDSYCMTCIRPHYTDPDLERHQLQDLQDQSLCEQHHKKLEFYCRTDQSAICSLCFLTDHKGHDIVEQVGTYTDQDAHETQCKVTKTGGVPPPREIQFPSVTLTWPSSECAPGPQRYTETRRRGQEQCIMPVTVEETGLLPGEKYHGHQRPYVGGSVHTGPWKRAALCLGLLCALLLSAIAVLSFKSSSLNQERSQSSYNNLNREKSQLQDKLVTMAADKVKLQKRLCNLRMEITQFAVDVTLDPDTANTYLILSADGKQVRHGDSSQNRPDNPKRFDPIVNVLGKQGFTSGRFYYEVEVSGKTAWTLGVARESINRKGQITLNPTNGFWAIWLRNGDEYLAHVDPNNVVLSLKEKPERVGVFVDYEAGLVSFYDADRWNLIYSFRGVSFKEKIYPYLSPSLHDDGKNSSPLIIVTPILCTK